MINIVRVFINLSVVLNRLILMLKNRFRKSTIRKKTFLYKVKLLLVILISLLSTSYFRNGDRKDIELDLRLNSVTKQIIDLQLILNEETKRDSVKQWLCKVIRFYNKEMSEDEMDSIASELYTSCIKYDNLTPKFLCALITHESAKTWDPEVVSFAGAIGLMQVMPTTGIEQAYELGIEWTTSDSILTDPVYNIRIGTYYLSGLIRQFGIKGGLIGYNSGEGNVYTWLRNGKKDTLLPLETQGYVPAIDVIHKSYISGSIRIKRRSM